MKKQLILFSALLLVLCMAVSCGSTGAAVTPAQTGTPAAKTESAAEGSTIEAAAAYAESAPATENAEPESGPADNAPAPSSTTPAPAPAAASSQPAKSTAAKAPKQTATASSGAAQPASQPAQQAAAPQKPLWKMSTARSGCVLEPAITFPDLQVMDQWLMGSRSQYPFVDADYERFHYPAQVIEAWTVDGKIRYCCPALALAENVENVKLTHIQLNLPQKRLTYFFTYETESVNLTLWIEGYYREYAESPVEIDPDAIDDTSFFWKNENGTRLVEGYHHVCENYTDESGQTGTMYEGRGWIKQQAHMPNAGNLRRPFFFHYVGRADAEGMDAMLKTIIPYLEMQIVTLDPAAEQ